MKTNTLSNTALSMALLGAAGALAAQTTEPEVKAFVRFDSFMEATRVARPAASTESRSRVKDDAAFEEMRQHILTMYKGVAVTHSYVRNSDHFDCVPVEQQPSVRILGLKSVASAPPQSVLKTPPAAPEKPGLNAKPATQAAGKTDAFGNAIGCDAKTVPMRRITLDEMTHFQTLQEFFQKGANGAGRAHPQQADPDLQSNHKFSIMYQNVPNFGGNSNLNIWSPDVNPAWGQVFTLSQQWYVGGSGPNTQTVEVGWQNYPVKYGNEAARLFIYWTADNYATTGCYNLDCPGFVQIDNSATLGGGFDTYSSFYGPQYEIGVQFFLYEGNWWLSIQGVWIGYYPGYLYRGGQLSYYAQAIEYGTESDAIAVWPGEGSGYWATAGFGLAAYQRNVFYIDGFGNGIYASLTPYNTSPTCYNTYGPFFDGTSSWGSYFYAGGIGGSGCQ